MWVDPIVHEIHVIRQKLMDDACGDLHEVIRLARQHRDPARLIAKGWPRRPEGWVDPKQTWHLAIQCLIRDCPLGI